MSRGLEGSTSVPARRERGAALVLALIASAVAFMLGGALLVMAGTEELRSKAMAERTQSRAAAEGAVRLVAQWFSSPDRAVALPEPSEWDASQRQGDFDLDGGNDALCDGSRLDGQWQGFPLVPSTRRTPADLGRLIVQACGDSQAPDLELEPGRTRDLMARALGPNVVIDRIAIYAGPPIGKSRSSLSIEVRVGIRRGELVVNRVTAIGRVALLPRRLGDEAVVAGGDVTLSSGASVAWGSVKSGGDVVLPKLDAPGAPRSGLPRKPEGTTNGWATGGVTDWNLATPEREFLLTELIGRSIQGRQVLSTDVVPPELPDPWLTFRAKGAIIAGGKRVGPAGAQQPLPYDPRVTTVQDDLSFLLANGGDADPESQGRFAHLASCVGGTTAAASSLRRFLLDPSGAHGEARWRENGTGPARTAADWLAESGDAPVAAAFLSPDAEQPAEVVTLDSARGIVVVQAKRVVLKATSLAKSESAHFPGEPFIDLGIDADGDGVMDPETIGNGKWDADLDEDGVADEVQSDGWELGVDLPPPYFVPDYDQDPTRLVTHPHEAFLNFAYPSDGKPGPVRTSFRAEKDAPAAPVEDLDGDGAIREGIDRTTTLGRDAEGALVHVDVNAHALIVNLAGDVELAPGYALLGAVHATGAVTLDAGASVRLDERLDRDGRLDVELPQGSLVALAFPIQGVRPTRPAGEAAPPEAAPPDEPDDAPAAPTAAPPQPAPPRAGGGGGGAGSKDPSGPRMSSRPH